MTGDNHTHPSQEQGGTAPRQPTHAAAWAIIGLAVLGIVIYLFVDHLPHVVAALPYIAIIGMAAMHLFGHRHHGGSHHPGGTQQHNHSDNGATSGPQDRS